MDTSISEVGVKPIPFRKTAIKRMLELQTAIGHIPDAKFGDEACPIKHHFADGLYIREMRGIKGTVVVTKLHKTNHPYFVLEGDVSVFTEEGTVRIKAPSFGITKAGTKRVGYFHEDTIWITVHATEETDLEKIEELVIAETYDDLPEYAKDTLEIESRRKLISPSVEEIEVNLCHG